MRFVVDTGVLVEAVAAVGARAWPAKRLVELGAAPDVAIGEAYAVLRARRLQDRIGDAHFHAAVEALGQAPLDIHPTQRLLHRMSELLHSVTAYDAAFVALAERLGLPLITTDARLAAAHGPSCEIRLLS